LDFSFDADGVAFNDIERIIADMWADLPFDRDALAGLKRDGLALDGINLGGPNPYHLMAREPGTITLAVSGPHADTLLDLWRIHFLRGLRPQGIIG